MSEIKGNALAGVRGADPDLADPLSHPAAGQRYRWNGIEYVVTRVSETGRWADIKVEGEGGWSKRQPLPLPPGSARVLNADAVGDPARTPVVHHDPGSLTAADCERIFHAALTAGDARGAEAAGES
jgi:hypothetical protein